MSLRLGEHRLLRLALQPFQSVQLLVQELGQPLNPNGAGKSTLLKLLSREIYPVRRDDSALRLFGRERWNIWDLRTRLGMVSHDLQVDYPDRVTGLDVVLSGFFSSQGIWKNHDVGPAEREAARTAVERLGVDDPPEMERVVLLADGWVGADGPKEEVLTGSRLSACFGTAVEVVRANGFYQAVPGASPER